MPDERRTEGETLFEHYLGLQTLALEYEQAYAGKSKVIDYGIQWHGKLHLLDVKDFESPTIENVTGTVALSADFLYRPIRERVTRCRKKFREYKEFCCAGVFFNNGAFAMLEYPTFMLGAMYGEIGYTMPFNAETGVFESKEMEQRFLRGGVFGSPDRPCNTTIAALLTLTTINPRFQRCRELVRMGRSVDESLPETANYIDTPIPRVIVWHNAFALERKGSLLKGL